MDASAAIAALDEVQSQQTGAGERVSPALGVSAALLRAPPLAHEWEALASAASEPNSFSEAWFASVGLKQFAVDADVRWLEVRLRATLIGLIPLSIGARYGRLKVRHVQNWLHYHSFLGTPLVRRGEEKPFWSAVLAQLDLTPWAKGFLHVNGLVDDGPVHRGLIEAAAELGRPCDVVHRVRRALLETELTPDAYYERTVRKKKRKELKRLQNRLAEVGTVQLRTLTDRADLPGWSEEFLRLERSGWKGEAGSALGSRTQSADFFRSVVAGAFERGKLDFLRLDLDDRPIAMLVNFLSAPGSFSWKIAFDEDFARFSPGVLIQIENLRILERRDIAWMDSCAVEGHPMIDSLWGERRTIVRVSVPLSGLRRRATFRVCRTAEDLWAAFKRPKSNPIKTRDQSDDD